MSNTFGRNLTVTIFGQSHSPAIGVTLDGFPAGMPIDFAALSRFLARRAPGSSPLSTARREADAPEFLCGLADGVTCGAPLTALIRNTDIRPQDYAALQNVPRPGHADYTASVRYGGHQDRSGGGQFSGRLTAPLCVAGGLCLQFLARRGVRISARIVSIGGVCDEAPFDASVSEKPFPVVTDGIGEDMQRAIVSARNEGDSLGGVIECRVDGLPAGLGAPMFDGMENRISQIVFAVPAVKGIEFGAGFAAAGMRGSEHNDVFRTENGRVVTETNHSGGILGGITNGMPLLFRAAVKPTPSIARTQRSVDLETMENTTLEIRGRHDPCIVPRAVPCMEAAAAIAIMDAWLDAPQTEEARWI